MESEDPVKAYFIWGIDNAPYGPVKLPVLIDWIQDERVLPGTWVFARGTSSWQKASEMPELENYFCRKIPAASAAPARAGFTPGSLRRIKILASLSDAQLAHLSEFMELKGVPQWAVVVRQGEPGDAMYLIMSGELRARTMI